MNLLRLTNSIGDKYMSKDINSNARVILPQTKAQGFRDPCAILSGGIYHLYYSLVQNEDDGQFFYLAESISHDLKNWSAPRILSPKGSEYNYSSPGNVFFQNNLYHMCIQTYPRRDGETYGNENSRIFIIHSKDLIHWTTPELLKVKGDIPVGEMGRMIDPYILQNGDEFLCFYKQNGVSFSKSKDLITWEYLGNCSGCGENVCVLKEGSSYYILHSPQNGLGLLKTDNFSDFEDLGTTTLNQEAYPWAKDRLTAGYILQRNPKHDKDILFFHGDDESNYTFGASIALIENWNFKKAFSIM